jgi:sec-independent protein translocase protein TatB
MFDIGFSEILVIFILALVVLGPEKLPRVVREIGRWVGRARAMARQFQEQLEEEVDVDRNRTVRSEPVRPVGGVPPAAPPEPVTGEHAEPVSSDPVSDLGTSWQTPPGSLPEAAATASDGRPPETVSPATHE